MEKEFNKNDEINLKDIFLIFLRNKKLIGYFSAIFFIFGIIFSIFSEKKWEGNFQIVLKSKASEEEGLIGRNPAINNLLPLTIAGTTDINTEVGILKSPAVLMPIFKYVLKEKTLLDKNYNLNFKQWKKNSLDISLQEGTYILDIIYRDKDKKVVLPVLTKISQTYQEYSDKKEKISYSYTIDFLNKQISKYKDKTKQSLKKVQEFAIDQDLVVMNEFLVSPQPENATSEFNVALNQDFELVRIRAKNNIKQIDLQIKKLESLDLEEDSSSIPFMGIIEDDLSIKTIRTSLDSIDEKIVLGKSKYTEKDPILKRLKEEKKETLKLLKARSIGILKAKRIVAESIEESASRPKDVLLEYKNLLRESYRDEMTLSALENKLRAISLANAKTKEPYELITKPTLLDKPIGLRKSHGGIIGVLFGTFLGFIYTILKEKNSKNIIVMDSIRKYIDLKILKRLETDIISENNNLTTYIMDKYSLEPIPINILFNKNISEEDFNLIKISLEILEEKEKIKINKFNLNDKFPKNIDLIFITSLNQLKRSQLEEISERFSILNVKVSALFCCD